MSALNEDRKSGPGIRTKLNTVRDRAMAAGEVAERGAGKAQFAQRRAEVQPDESKPEGDAVDAVEDAGQELADDAEHIGEAAVHRIGEVVHKRKESRQRQDNGEGIQTEGVDGGEHVDTSAESPIEINRDDEAASGRQEDLCQPKASHKDTSQAVQPCANESEVPDSSLQGTGKKDSPVASESSSEPISDAPVSDVPVSDMSTPDEEAPRRSRQNRSRLKRKEALTADGTPQPDKTGIGTSDDAPLSAPRSRLLSPEELESARARSIENLHLPESTVTSSEEFASLGTEANASDLASNVPDVSPAPRVHQPRSDLCHERPTPQTPRQREILREPVASARVVESQPRIEIRTADIDAKVAGRTGSAAGNAAMNGATNAYANAAADAAKQKAAEETSNRIASHMRELSKRAAEKMMRALKQSGRAGLRATEAAAKALVDTLIAGSGVVVVVILVILMCASILASPFGIFTHSDGIEDPGSYTLEKAISDINDEYVTAVQRKASGQKNVTIVIEGNIEEEIEPVNWVDVLGVFSVHVTMRAQNAMNIVDLGEAQLRELRNVLQKGKTKGGSYYIAPFTKSNKPRTIKAPAIAFDYLRREQKRQAANQLHAGEMWDNPDNLVFTNDLGGHLKIFTFYSHFKKIATGIGRPDARPHDLRHTAATVAIASGSDVKSVQSMLGHATASFTLNVYAHTSEKMMEDTADRMQEYYNSLDKKA